MKFEGKTQLLASLLSIAQALGIGPEMITLFGLNVHVDSEALYYFIPIVIVVSNA